MTDIVGRDKIEQSGDDTKASITNTSNPPEKPIMKIVVSVIIGLTLFIIEEIIRRNFF